MIQEGRYRQEDVESMITAVRSGVAGDPLDETVLFRQTFRDMRDYGNTRAEIVALQQNVRAFMPTLLGIEGIEEPA